MKVLRIVDDVLIAVISVLAMFFLFYNVDHDFEAIYIVSFFLGGILVGIAATAILNAFIIGPIYRYLNRKK